MKRLSLILALAMILGLFTGCAHKNHEWSEATCTEPRKCAVGGETEGEPLGHDWAPATCTEPRTCRRCGQTEGEPEPAGHDWAPATCTEPETCRRCGKREGEPLGHTPTEADYWNPSVCAVCGEELGPMLTPDFVAYGLDGSFMELGQTYDYVTACHENHDARTTAHLTVESYEITPGDGVKMEITDGYEWRVVTIRAVFDDSNARKWGMEISNCFENYYDIVGWDDSGRAQSESAETFDVLWDGRMCPVTVLSEQGFLGWENQKQTNMLTVRAHVPVGYDGFIVGYRDASAEWGDDQHIFDVADENTLFFRLA